MNRTSILCCLILTFSLSVSAEEKSSTTSPEIFRAGDRVVLLGGTFFERAQRFGYLEQALMDTNKKLTFRNLGWSGDTVFAESRGLFDAPQKGYERMLAHLQRLKPTVVLVNYGANESFAGKAGLSAFLAQLEKLTADIQKLGARVVIVTPHQLWKLPAPLPDPAPRNANLALYSQALREFAADHKMPVLDLNAIQFDFQPGKLSPGDVTQNTLHLTAEGYWQMANKIRRLLQPEPALHLSGGKVVTARDLDVRNINAEAEQITLELRAAQLPLPVSPGAQAANNFLSLTVDGLKKGQWECSIDGEMKVRARQDDWKKGFGTWLNSDATQAEKIRRLVLRKNELYFYRWRPQNVTYLFLFRKHEQGQNAREIPMFDPLVEKLETEIEELNQPAWHKVVWKRIGD